MNDDDIFGLLAFISWLARNKPNLWTELRMEYSNDVLLKKEKGRMKNDGIDVLGFIIWLRRNKPDLWNDLQVEYSGDMLLKQQRKGDA